MASLRKNGNRGGLPSSPAAGFCQKNFVPKSGGWDMITQLKHHRAAA
jgi:hypothetical protein